MHGADGVARAERASAALFAEDIATLDEQTLLEAVDEAPSSVLPAAALGERRRDVTEPACRCAGRHWSRSFEG